MSRESIAAALQQAERQVIRGERRIADQRKLIKMLEADDHPTADARELLKTLEAMHVITVTDRDQLRQSLRAAE